MKFAQPEKLSVYARYTRKRRMDINPFRSNFEPIPLTSVLHANKKNFYEKYTLC